MIVAARSGKQQTFVIYSNKFVVAKKTGYRDRPVLDAHVQVISSGGLVLIAHVHPR